MPTDSNNPFGTRGTIRFGNDDAVVFRLSELARQGIADLDRLPFSIRVLLENALRHAGRGFVTESHISDLSAWGRTRGVGSEIPFMPARVVLQDFTGVPCVVDLAAMRDAMARMKGDPDRINPVVPCDLVIDHSVQVDYFGSEKAFKLNVELELERNVERYQLLKFAQRAFHNFRVVPPGTGIVHQVNLEYLASVVQLREQFGQLTAYPDTLVGTDSHTTMINGLGVLGWGVGGIEAEAVMLGQPYFMLIPEVVGMRLVGELPIGTTATDLVLHATRMLREKGVVDKFVEFFGPGLTGLGLADRATIANMAPEYGATMGFFPVDAETLRYLERTGRGKAVVDRVERYCKEQGLFRTDATPEPAFTSTIELDLSIVVPSLAGPKRPQDLVPLTELKRNFIVNLPNLMSPGVPAARKELAQSAYSRWVNEGGASVTIGDGGDCPPAQLDPDAPPIVSGKLDEADISLHDGSVVIAAITSCTNTSNPSVMIGAGLVARKAVERGLMTKPWVKTSLAPGSRVVTDYLEGSGLLPYLEKLRLQYRRLRLHHVHRQQRAAARAGGAAHRRALPGDGGRAERQPELRGSDAPAGAGQLPRITDAGRRVRARRARVDIDLSREPLGTGKDGQPVYLEGHLAHLRRSARHHVGRRSSRRSSSGATPRCSRATRSGSGCRCPKAAGTRGTRQAPTWPSRPSSRTSARNRDRFATSTAPARPGRARRFGDHRPHLAGGVHSQERARGEISARSWGPADRLEHLRRAPRSP